MLRVIHTADTHIGYRQYHSDARRHDFLHAFEQVIDDAIEADVAAVVHAGDLFHDKRPDLRDLQGTIAALARLRLAQIPFLGIVGNHERKRDAQWLDLFADLDLAVRLGPKATVIDEVAFYGLDYLTPATREKGLDLEIAEDASVSVLVGHGIIEGLPYGDWDLDALLDGLAVEMDVVLLGDYHEHELEHRDGTLITYSGSTERASADERAPRGYNLMTVEEGAVAVTHRTLPGTRAFEYVDVHLGEDEGEARVLDSLDEVDLEDAVAIVTIEGAGESVSPATVEAHARDRGALVARVRDRRDGTGETDEAGLSVSFADPDRAVRAAMVETELSEAAHQLDELIRDRAIPDSRVRERARVSIESLLEEDPEAISRAATVEEPTDTVEADESVEEAAERTESDEPTTATDESDDQSIEEEEVITESTGEADTTEGASEDTDEREELLTASDGQASMEDYL